MSRLAACLDLMRAEGVDALVLGREANARVVADTARLWLAGTRAFSPSCVVMATTGAVHVLANSDDAVPAGFPVERLYGVTWNPAVLEASLRAIPGLADARRIGVDGMNAGAAAMLARVAPGSELTDANRLLARLWAVPDPAGATAVAAAAEIACTGLAAMAARLAPGADTRTLRGACAAAFAAFGVTTPAFEAVAAPLDPGYSTWLAADITFDEGDVLVLRAGALRDGFEASLARTYRVGQPAPVDPSGWSDAVAACAAGATVGSLRHRGIVVYGEGRGVEPWDDALVLAPGHVCALELATDDALRQDVFRVTAGAPELLTNAVP